MSRQLSPTHNPGLGSPSPSAAGWVTRRLPKSPHQRVLPACESVPGLHAVQFLLNGNLPVPFPLPRALAEGAFLWLQT